MFVNFNAVFIDTCRITIGARTLLAPGVQLYSGRHPLDPEVRNGTKGPEDGAEIHIGEDCWLGGNVIVLPGVRIGEGSTVGAGSVVTKVCVFFLLFRVFWAETDVRVGCAALFGSGGQSGEEDSRRAAEYSCRGY